MSKKNDFRKTWRTLTELGQEFGVSAVKFGYTSLTRSPSKNYLRGIDKLTSTSINFVDFKSVKLIGKD